MNLSGGDGAEVIYALRNDETLSKSVLNNIAREGQNIRGYYQRRLPSDPSKDYYFIHRETGNLQPILVEYGFIDSPKDDVVQLQNNITNYAEAVVKAVADYIGVPYVAPGGQSPNTYVVKRGDSLFSIANNFGVSVEALKNANGISGNLITIGQVLNIPTNDKTPGDYMIYTVKRGDSLWDIANQYNVSVNDIVDYNNLGTTLLQIGQQLLILNSTNVTEDDETGITYIVRRGDTLWSIAKRYNVPVADLKRINGLTSNLLTVGQNLIIPETTEYKTYIVRSGDSLYKIARDNNVNVNDLIALNNLNSTVLQIGQQLLIP